MLAECMQTWTNSFPFKILNYFNSIYKKVLCLILSSLVSLPYCCSTSLFGTIEVHMNPVTALEATSKLWLWAQAKTIEAQVGVCEWWLELARELVYGLVTSVFCHQALVNLWKDTTPHVTIRTGDQLKIIEQQSWIQRWLKWEIYLICRPAHKHLFLS